MSCRLPSSWGNHADSSSGNLCLFGSWLSHLEDLSTKRPRPDGGVPFIPPRGGLGCVNSFIHLTNRTEPCCDRASGPVSESLTSNSENAESPVLWEMRALASTCLTPCSRYKAPARRVKWHRWSPVPRCSDRDNAQMCKPIENEKRTEICPVSPLRSQNTLSEIRGGSVCGPKSLLGRVQTEAARPRAGPSSAGNSRQTMSKFSPSKDRG